MSYEPPSEERTWEILHEWYPSLRLILDQWKAQGVDPRPIWEQIKSDIIGD